MHLTLTPHTKVHSNCLGTTSAHRTLVSQLIPTSTQTEIAPLPNSWISNKPRKLSLEYPRSQNIPASGCSGPTMGLPSNGALFFMDETLHWAVPSVWRQLQAKPHYPPKSQGPSYLGWLSWLQISNKRCHSAAGHANVLRKVWKVYIRYVWSTWQLCSLKVNIHLVIVTFLSRAGGAGAS